MSAVSDGTESESAVSEAVARLREADTVINRTDPADRRRSLIRQNPVASARVREVGATPIDAAVAAALDSSDDRVVEQVLAALDILAHYLLDTTEHTPKAPDSSA